MMMVRLSSTRISSFNYSKNWGKIRRLVPTVMMTDPNRRSPRTTAERRANSQRTLNHALNRLTPMSI